MLLRQNLLILILCFNIIDFVNCFRASKSEDDSDSDETSEDDVYSLLHSALRNFTANLSQNRNKTIAATSVQNFTVSRDPPVIEDDDFDYERVLEWKTKDTVEGYEIISDGLQFRSKLMEDSGKVHIRVEVGVACTFEKIVERRVIILMIRTWDKMHRIRIKIPFGVLPDEVEVEETLRHIDVFAPYGFIEHRTSTTPTP